MSEKAYLVYEDGDDNHVRVVHCFTGTDAEKRAKEMADRLNKESDDKQRELAKTSTYKFIEPEDREWRNYDVGEIPLN